MLAAAAVPEPEEKKFLGVPVFTWQKILPLGEWRRRARQRPYCTARWCLRATGAAVQLLPPTLLLLLLSFLPVCTAGLMFFCILFNYTILRDTKVWRCAVRAPPD